MDHTALYTDYMATVIFIELAKAPIVPLPGFENHTAVLSSFHKFRTHTVLGFWDPNIPKGPGVAGVFNGVPSLDGKWTLEIAIELADLLPAIDGKSEAILNANDKNGTVQQLCLSNRISRFHFQDGKIAYHALVPRTETWHGSVQVKGSDGATLNAAEEQLRTMAGMRFQIEGETTEQAFESSITQCLDKLFDSVNVALDATRDSGVSLTPITRSVSSDTIAAAYVLVSGSGNPQGSRLILSGLRALLYPVDVQGEQATRFRSVVDGSLPLGDVDRLLGEALSSWQGGEYEFAFLQTVIAAEIATARAVRAECIRRGVSKNKLDDNRREMTYSWALNIGIPLCLPPTLRPKDTLVAAMNAARSKRNDLMHEATFELTRGELGQLIGDTKEFVRALKNAEALNNASANPNGPVTPARSISPNDVRGNHKLG